MLISKYDNTDIEQFISDYETKHEFAFPTQYREFLFKFNGGDTPETEFTIGKISSDLEGLFGLGNANEFLNYSFFDSMDGIRDFLEDLMLPIGINVFGDFIVIGIGEENNGKIFFLYHDRPKKYIELVGSFELFVSKCKSKEIGYIWTIEERKAELIANGLGDELTQDRINGWQAEIDAYSNMRQEELVL